MQRTVSFGKLEDREAGFVCFEALYHYEPTENLFLSHIYACKSTASRKWEVVF